MTSSSRACHFFLRCFVGIFDKPEPNEWHAHMLSEILLTSLDKLTAWEEEFVSDMDDKLTDGSALTKGQAEKLEEIHDRVCG